MKFRIANLHRWRRPPTRSVLKALAKIFHPVLHGKYDISVIWIDDRTIAKIAHRFFGHRHATDVLAFSGESGESCFGEVLISLDTAWRQASLRGVPFAHELLLLITHGTLHLFGMDDLTRKGWGAMRKAEFEVLMRML